MLYKRCACVDPDHCLHPYWYLFRLFGRRYRSSTRTANKRTSERIEHKRRNDLVERKEGVKKIDPTSLSDHVADYLAHTKTTNKTAYKDTAVLEKLQDIIGLATPISEISSFDLERWKTARVGEVSRSTVNREMNIVRGCFSRAVDWGRLVSSPATKVKNYKVDDQRIRVLTDAELTTVLAIPDPFVVLICRATLESLARISELLHLHRSHIGPGWIEIRRKGGAVDRIPVSDDLRTALLARSHDLSGFVFGEGALGRIPTQQTASNRVLRALTAAGVLEASHHTMRHTGVTLMLEKGVNPRAIQRLAGWSSLRMLERYGHARDAELRRAVSGMTSYLDDLSAASDPRPNPATTAATDAPTDLSLPPEISPQVVAIAAS